MPKALYPWAETKYDKRERMLTILEYLKENVAETYLEIQREAGVDDSTVSRYFNDDGALGACVVEDHDIGGYTLTPIGETALELPWDDVVVE